VPVVSRMSTPTAVFCVVTRAVPRPEIQVIEVQHDELACVVKAESSDLAQHARNVLLRVREHTRTHTRARAHTHTDTCSDCTLLRGAGFADCILCARIVCRRGGVGFNGEEFILRSHLSKEAMAAAKGFWHCFRRVLAHSQVQISDAKLQLLED
jgi:hypothetical protein